MPKIVQAAPETVAQTVAHRCIQLASNTNTLERLRAIYEEIENEEIEDEATFDALRNRECDLGLTSQISFGARKYRF